MEKIKGRDASSGGCCLVYLVKVGRAEDGDGEGNSWRPVIPVKGGDGDGRSWRSKTGEKADEFDPIFLFSIGSHIITHKPRFVRNR